jgi:hypothetical protein
MAHEYTVATPHGDVNLTTEHHHSKFRSIEDFLKHHHDAIADAIGVTSLAVSALGVFLSHGRRGAKIK